MKRQKLHFTWEVLDKLLKLKGRKIYNAKILDNGMVFDVHGGEIESVEGAINYSKHINTLTEGEW